MGSKSSSQTIPITVTPSTIGKKASVRSTDPVLVSSTSRCASEIPITFWTTVTPRTKIRVSMMLAVKPGACDVNSCE